MANGTSDNSPLSSAANAAKESAAEAIVATKETLDHAADQARAHPIRDQVSATVGTIKDEARRHADNLKGEAANLKDQASTKARDAATAGKGKAAEAVGSLAKLLQDSAPTVDEKLGKQYGDYARSAATSVSGFASNLDQKDIDELAENARDFVRKSPAVAVGAAAVVGFVLARMLKGGSKD